MIKRKNNIMLTEIQAFGIGVLVSLIVMVLLLIVSTICINNEYMDMEKFGSVSLIMQVITCLSGGVAAGSIRKDIRKKACVVVGCAFFCLQLLTALVLFEGVASGFWWLALGTAIAVIIGVFLVVATDKRGRGRNKSRHRK